MGGKRPTRKDARRARERRRAGKRALTAPVPAVTPPAPAPVTSADDAPPPRAGWRARVLRAYGLGDARTHAPVTLTLAAGTVLSYIGPGSIMPLLVLYFTGVVGIPLEFMAVVVIAQEVTRAIASPFFGGLSDRIGRKPLMLLGLVMQAAAFMTYLFAHDEWTLVFAAIVYGLGHAPYHPAVNALVSDVSPTERRASAFGLVHMGKNLGYTLGIGLGALLLTLTGGYRVLFFTGAAFPLAFALVVAFFIREPARRASAARPPNPFASVATALRNPRFALFVLLAMTVFVAWGQLVWVLPKFVTDGLGFDERWVSIVMLVNSALVLLFQVPLSRRADRWRREEGLAAAGVVNAAAYAIFAVLALGTLADPSGRLIPVGLLVGAIVFTIAEMLDTPLLFALASDLAPEDVTGGAMGVLGLAAPVGLALAPLLGGLATGAWGWAMTWLAFAALVGGGGIGFLFLSRAFPSAPASSAPTIEPSGES